MCLALPCPSKTRSVFDLSLKRPVISTCLLYSVFLPTSMSYLCLCAKGLVSSASQLMPSYHRLQYSCGQRIQHICPPLPDSCSPDSMPALEITRDPCTWDNLCVLVLFFQSQPSTHSTPPNLISATSSPSSSPLYPLPFSPVFSAPLGFAASFLCLPSHEYPAHQSCFFMVLQANSPWLFHNAHATGKQGNN